MIKKISDNFNSLIGKKLIEPSTLSKDKSTITLETEKSTITLIASGDGCTTSWVEHFDSIPAGEIINEVKEKDVNVLKEENIERLQQYFYEIITDKGSYTIEMHNESNGYYGGFFIVNETENDK